MVAFIVLAVLASPLSKANLQVPDPDLDPATYLSSSGKFALWVNPSEPDGSGPATYRLSEGTTVKWTKTLPFTFHKASVTDTGRSIGYGYTQGRTQVRDLDVAIISEKGDVLLEDKHPRTYGFEHEPPGPYGIGILPDPVSDRWLVSVSRGSWFKYSLEQARFLGEVKQASGVECANWIVDEQCIVGTPLILADWWHFSDGMGVVYALHDRDGKVVWKLEMPSDYELSGSEEEQDKMRDLMQTKGSILRSDQANRFDLRFVRAGQRVTFEVREELGKWQVSEVSRTPYAPPVGKVEKPVKLVVAERQLQVIRQVVLPVEGGKKVPELGRIDAFFPLDRGRFAVLRNGTNLDLIDGRGAKVRTVDLGQVDEGRSHRLAAHLGGSKFLLITSKSGENGSAHALTVDLSTGDRRDLLDFKCDDVNAITGFPDGSFAALSTEHSKYSSTEHLGYYGPTGKLVWMNGEAGFGGDDAELLSPEDLASTKAGWILVLDNIRDSLQVYDRSGKLVKFLDLGKVWDKKPSYPVEVIETRDGGYAMNDFGGEPPMYVMGPDGVIRQALLPRYKDGKAVARFDGPVQDSEGALWISDGKALMQVGKDGIVARLIGPEPASSGLSEIGDIHIDAVGTIYALDINSGEVHLFDKDGKRTAVAKPLAKDFDKRPLEYAWLKVARSGDIYVGGGTGEGDLHFSPTGARLGYVDYPSTFGNIPVSAQEPYKREVSPQWRWHGTLLLDENGKDVARLRRWPDLRWMTDGPSAVAPDGRLMSFGGPEDPMGFRLQAPDRIAFFTPGGLPEGMAPLPKGLGIVASSAFDGALSYFQCEESIVAIDRTGRAIWRFTPKGGIRSICPSLGGLAVFDGEKTITWYSVKGH